MNNATTTTAGTYPCTVRAIALRSLLRGFFGNGPNLRRVGRGSRPVRGHTDNMTAEIFSEQGIIVLLIAVVILFGGSKIPQLARSLGQAKKEFQGGLSEGATDTTASEPTTERTPD